MAEEDNNWFEECFDALYQFIGILDGQGRVIRANRAALAMTGLKGEDVTGVPLWSIPWTALTPKNRQILARATGRASRGEFKRSELKIQRPGLPEMIIDFSLKPILDEDGSLRFMIAEGRDITFYRQTTEALFQSEARFETIFEEAGIGIVIKGVDGKMLDCNPAFQTMLGYPAEELIQRDYLDITHPLDKETSRKLFDELVSGQRKSYSIEKRYLQKDGQITWGRITASLVRGQDGQALFVIGMVENITTQKQIENELVELQRRLMQGREKERLRVAQDLHDGPLQEIIAASFQVQELEGLIEEEAGREQLAAIRAALQQLSRSVRGICGELRPPTLVPFGLEKTILSHMDEFRAAHPELAVELDLAHDGQILPEHIRIVLFRIYQETLNNILRHAQAHTIKIHFQLTEEHAILEIQDDGVGFDLPRRWVRLARQGHLGLVGAMERAGEVGGSLEVTTARGHGTLIRAVVPLKEELTLAQITGEEDRP